MLISYCCELNLTSEKSYALLLVASSQKPKLEVPKQTSATIGGNPNAAPAPIIGETLTTESLSFICWNILVSYEYLATRVRSSFNSFTSSKLENSVFCKWVGSLSLYSLLKSSENAAAPKSLVTEPGYKRPINPNKPKAVPLLSGALFICPNEYGEQPKNWSGWQYAVSSCGLLSSSFWPE